MVDRANRPSALHAPSAAAPGPQVDISGSGASSRVTARLPSGESVEILLHGATVISWKSDGGEKENLWLSEKAVLDGSKAVRGGVPIVFPVFGPPPANHATSSLPQHGFARTSRWEFLGKSTSEDTVESSAVKLDFGLYSSNLSAEARKAWPYDFGLVYSVTLSKDSLQTVMNVRNEGTEVFEFQMLFHTYLRVKDITTTTLTGLLGVPYTDKVLNNTTSTQSTPSLSITSEIDRVYTSIPQSTATVLENGTPRFDIVRDNVEDTVVWNPWKEKAAAMADFAPQDGWKNMICVEVGTVGGWQRLEGGDGFEGGQVVKSLL
ncbi:galactose mutarotase-like protein [Lepidopterella palustris CBS 459.81]|uniref:Glucose-6-phosphate 1-epimerase n=1 Tax=Lepidopterella palustris CBS 459.81 TaxID=1314670 RepID=A0A8E2EII9_9PEZI|nr:galactose mutarotase-like protein [Lepidopterella palustris CBS 459.81]